MTAPRPSTAVRTALGVSLAVVLFLATLGSVGAGFGVMTDCTNAYDCTVTGCAPCRTTNAWLTAGWLGQGGLLLAGVVLAVLAARRRRLRAVRLGALLLGPSSVALFVVTTALAVAAV
jgi:hypothetical protein